MFRAIGLVVLLIAIKIMMPGLFGSVDQAGTKFFNAIGRTADFIDPSKVKISGLANPVAGVNYIPKPAPFNGL